MRENTNTIPPPPCYHHPLFSRLFHLVLCNRLVMTTCRTVSNANGRSRTWKLLLTVCILVSFFENCAFAGQQFSLAGTIFERAGDEYNVDPALLYSIALVESAIDDPDKAGFINPFPWTLRSTRPFYGKNRQEAEKELLRLLKTHKSIDVGLMQINTKWHGHKVNSPTALLDTHTNVRIEAQIRSEQIDKTADAEMAIGRYHSFDPERARWYAHHVLRVYTQIRHRGK